MAFTTSGVFVAFIRDSLNNTTSHSFDVDADTINVALFGNTGTPDKTVANTLSGYNQATSQWVTANEVTATGWTAGGLALASVTSSVSSNVYTFDAADRAGGATDTVTNCYGVLVYDNTLATKDGLSFNYLGGANSVTSGTFTVVWNASGIFTITV
jgi:hypothetical protein